MIDLDKLDRLNFKLAAQQAVVASLRVRQTSHRDHGREALRYAVAHARPDVQSYPLDHLLTYGKAELIALGIDYASLLVAKRDSEKVQAIIKEIAQHEAACRPFRQLMGNLNDYASMNGVSK